jgi:hypothetical protein
MARGAGELARYSTSLRLEAGREGFSRSSTAFACVTCEHAFGDLIRKLCTELDAAASDTESSAASRTDQNLAVLSPHGQVDFYHHLVLSHIREEGQAFEEERKVTRLFTALREPLRIQKVDGGI